jgi:hypothetical protein
VHRRARGTILTQSLTYWKGEFGPDARARFYAPLKKWPRQDTSQGTKARCFWEFLRFWVRQDMFGLIDPDIRVREYHLEGFKGVARVYAKGYLERDPSRDQLEELMSPWLESVLGVEMANRYGEYRRFIKKFLQDRAAPRQDLFGWPLFPPPSTRPPLVLAVIPFTPAWNYCLFPFSPSFSLRQVHTNPRGRALTEVITSWKANPERYRHRTPRKPLRRWPRERRPNEQGPLSGKKSFGKACAHGSEKTSTA